VANPGIDKYSGEVIDCQACQYKGGCCLPALEVAAEPGVWGPWGPRNKPDDQRYYNGSLAVAPEQGDHYAPYYPVEDVSALSARCSPHAYEPTDPN
jgi:hypothetical protein